MLSHLSRALVWPLVISLNFLACLLVVLCVLLGSNYGTEQGFAMASRWLPLRYESVNGNLLHQLNIRGLHYQDESIDLTVGELDWLLNLRSLWQTPAFVHIQALHINQTSIQLKGSKPQSTKPQSSQAFALQDLELPLAMQLDSLELNDVSLQQGEQRYAVKQLKAVASASHEGELQIQASLIDGPFNSQAQLSASAQMTAAAATASLSINQAQAVLNGKSLNASGAAELRYNDSGLQLKANSLAANYDSARLSVNGALAPAKTLTFGLSLPSLQLLNADLSGKAELSGSIKNSETFNVNGSLAGLNWLGQPQIQRGDFAWQGTLANQILSAQLTSPYWGQQPLKLNSQFGWYGSWLQLQQASALAVEDLLKQANLHFQASAKLAQAELAVSGVSLRNNQLDIQLIEDGEIALSGHSDSGEGSVSLQGKLQLLNSASQELAVKAKLSGKKYQLAKTPELQLSASPDLNISLANGQLKLAGDIVLDNGHIEIILPESSAIKPSADVVFVNAAEPPQTAAIISRDINVQLIIQQPITIKGQGFNGSASGRLNVSESQGQQPKARGELRLAGRYKAYGQDLDIRRGKLIYVDSPLDDPGIDLEAIRTVQNQIAGVRVSGLASNPKIKVFAEPALSDTEALSYLVLGRGLNASSERDQNQLRNLALSLGLSQGGKLLENSKDKLGVDELSIQTGDNNNQASLLLGRQLSERLYLSTQIGLFEPVNKLLLRYTLSRQCELVAETGSQQGADLVCSIKSEAK